MYKDRAGLFRESEVIKNSRKQIKVARKGFLEKLNELSRKSSGYKIVCVFENLNTNFFGA